MCEGTDIAAFGWCRAHYKRWKRHGVLYSPKAVAGLRSATQRSRDYYVAHRAERLQYQRERRSADPEGARANERAVYRRRRDKHQATNRARERSLTPLGPSGLAYEQILRRDPCSYCGVVMKQQIDHIVPVVASGENAWTNLTAACAGCNRAKSATPLLVFLAGGH